MEITAKKPAIYRALVSAFGGNDPTVTAYHDGNQHSSVEVVRVQDRPQAGMTAAGTIGASDHEIGLMADELPLRVEFVAAFASEETVYERILATCAFNIINLGYKAYPGAIYPDLVKIYLPDSPMQHILLLPPLFWEGELTSLRLSDRVVTWLMALPISERELRYAEMNGVEALEDRLIASQVDPTDLRRHSII